MVEMENYTKNYLESLSCPKCRTMMEWAGQDCSIPYAVDYHCDGIYDEASDSRSGGCGYKGTYDWHTTIWDEYSSEDYAISDNWPVEEALKRADELGVDITSFEAGTE